MTPTKTRAWDEIGDDDPITLQEACDFVFRGNIKVPTLRAHVERKELRIFRIGRRDFTTKRFVREMQQLCQDERTGRISTLTPGERLGQSAMERASSALAALNQTTRALKSSSPNTSQASSGPRRAPRH